MIPLHVDHKDFDGLSIYEPGDILPPMIFLNPDMPGDRWRLTLAHELGHIVLHHHQRMLPEHHELEREAYDFATEFLAPRQESASHLRSVSMQRLAQISHRVADSVWHEGMRAVVPRVDRVARREGPRLHRLRGRGRGELLAEGVFIARGAHGSRRACGAGAGREWGTILAIARGPGRRRSRRGVRSPWRP